MMSTTPLQSRSWPLPTSPVHTSTLSGSADHGSVQNMLLIHGVGMNSRYWDNIKDKLAQHFLVTTVDMPGHGDSACFKDNDPTLAEYTDAIAQHIALPTIVVGHSMGALIALDMAVRYKHKIAGIAVLNAIYRRDRGAKKAVLDRVAGLNDTDTPDTTNTLLRWFGAAPSGVQKDAADHCKNWLNAVNPRGYRHAYQAFALADAPTDRQLAGITCPALLMTGSEEPNSTPAMSKKMSAPIPAAQCVIIEGARHMMSLTHGTETTQAIRDFFTTKLTSTTPDHQSQTDR